MTIEQLQSEKRVLKEKIEKAVREFCEATGLEAEGRFLTERESARDENGLRWMASKPLVIIKPIKI